MKRAHVYAVILNAAIALQATAATNQIDLQDWASGEHRVASRAGQEALQIHPTDWQHVQSAHFVLHSSDKGVAQGTAQEAEFYFDAIREDLKLGNAEASRKSHIFLFAKEADWRDFAKRIQVDPWTGGFFDGLDLFFWRKTGLGVHHSSATLPHEIAHRVLYEKFPLGSIPLALNEGFAEYESRKLAFRYLRPRGYKVRANSNPVARDKFISAAKLLAMTRYPEGDDNVTAFYDLSERCVNLLLTKHGQDRFLEFLQAMAKGQSFAAALTKVYSAQYYSVDQFERAFEEYAIVENNK